MAQQQQQDPVAALQSGHRASQPTVPAVQQQQLTEGQDASGLVEAAALVASAEAGIQ